MVFSVNPGSAEELNACMKVSLSGNVIISCYARGEGTPYDGLYGEAPPEIPERHSTNICTERLRPEVQPLTCQESVLYW